MKITENDVSKGKKIKGRKWVERNESGADQGKEVKERK